MQEGLSGILKQVGCLNFSNYAWDKVFKSGRSKICGRKPLKNLKGYGLLKHTIFLQIF